MKTSILILNGDSSSIKFTAYTAEEPPKRGLRGHLSRIGLPDTRLIFAPNAAVISTDASRVTVRVMATDEEQMIARHVSQLLASLKAHSN